MFFVFSSAGHKQLKQQSLQALWVREWESTVLSITRHFMHTSQMVEGQLRSMQSGVVVKDTSAVLNFIHWKGEQTDTPFPPQATTSESVTSKSHSCEPFSFSCFVDFWFYTPLNCRWVKISRGLHCNSMLHRSFFLMNHFSWQDKSRCIFSLDGNFALVHKQRGELAQKSRHTTAFFIPDDNVQEFTQKWLADKRRVDTVWAFTMISFCS